MTDTTVLYEARGAVALITLNRPQALNSFTRQMHRDLWAALDRAEADPAIRAIVFTGAGRGFCAGADLAEFDFKPGEDLVQRADPGPVIDQAFNPTTRRLQNLRVPTVCAVNGVAAGAGVSFVMACDIAIADPNATFIQAFSRIGLVPDAGGTHFLVSRVGMARALGCALLADKLTAQDAKDWGLIWDVAKVELPGADGLQLEGDDCLKAAFKLGSKLASMPTRALVATRHLLRDSTTRTLNEQLDVERDTQSAMGKTHDYIEGVMAFREKRAPKFKGE